MGFDNTFVVARWEWPLTDLAVNSRVEPQEMRAPDDVLSWARADGWQCYAPEGGYYDGELVPPVLDIAAETGGPVLGIGVARDCHYRICFVESGRLRTIAEGPDESHTSEAIRQEMIDLWGQPWQQAAADSLCRWAEPFVSVPALAVYGALAIPHMFAQTTVFDLLKILTLTPDPDTAGTDGRGFLSDVWWSTQVPEAVYAVEASEILHPGLVQPQYDYGHRDLVLAFTSAGAGIWSLHDSRWETEPSPHLRHTIHALRDRLRQRGWSTTIMPPGRNLTEAAEQIPETPGST